MECVVAKDHILANQYQITRQQLTEHGVLIQSHSTHTRNIIDNALELDENTNIIMESNYLETIKAMIQNGLGWGVLPQSMIDNSLHQLKIKGVRMNRHLGVLLHEFRTLSSPANALLDTLASQGRTNSPL
jgi:DNA-binding transcriptional LysR family regulator